MNINVFLGPPPDLLKQYLCNQQSCCHVALRSALDENSRKLLRSSFLSQASPGHSLPFSDNAYFFLPDAQTKSFGVILALAFILTPRFISKSCWLCLLSKYIQEKNINMFLCLGFITSVDTLIHLFFYVAATAILLKFA